jgi:hypothetical protein
MITALAIMALGAIVLGAALGYASIRFKVEGDPLVEKIEAILPQTQCGQCGYPGCKPYAAAISAGEADINLCPPGGMDGVRKLADLLGREVKPLDAEEKPKQVAIIDEADLHRLHAVHPGLPGRCHRRRRQADAHHHRAAVHRLRTVRQTLPGRVHQHASRSPRISTTGSGSTR